MLVSLCFLTDIYLNFMTAYLDGDQFVLDRSMIAQNYFRGWFLLDLSSSIPLELIDVLVQFFSSESSSGGSGLRMLRALRLVRLLRLLRLLKIQTYINLLEDMLAINMAFLSLVKLVFLIMYITHILGCSWYYLAASAMADDALARTMTLGTVRATAVAGGGKEHAATANAAAAEGGAADGPEVQAAAAAAQQAAYISRVARARQANAARRKGSA